MRFLLLIALLLGCSRQQPLELPWILEVAPAEMESSFLSDSRTYGVIWGKLRDEGGSMVYQGRYFALVRQHEDRAKAFASLYSPFTRWAADNDIERFRVWHSTDVSVGPKLPVVFINDGGAEVLKRTDVHGLMDALAQAYTRPDPSEDDEKADWGIHFVW